MFSGNIFSHWLCLFLIKKWFPHENLPLFIDDPKSNTKPAPLCCLKGICGLTNDRGLIWFNSPYCKTPPYTETLKLNR